MAKSKDITNSEGYTWVEWLAAVGLEPGQMIKSGELEMLSVAWEVGEDPADHRKRLDHNKWRESQRHGATEDEHVGRIVCRGCGNSDVRRYTLTEPVEAQHRVIEIVGGMVQVHKHRKVPDNGLGLVGASFECGACHYRNKIPHWMIKKIDWVE